MIRPGCHHPPRMDFEIGRQFPVVVNDGRGPLVAGRDIGILQHSQANGLRGLAVNVSVEVDRKLKKPCPRRNDMLKDVALGLEAVRTDAFACELKGYAQVRLNSVIEAYEELNGGAAQISFVDRS